MHTDQEQNMMNMKDKKTKMIKEEKQIVREESGVIFFKERDDIRDHNVTGVQTCDHPIRESWAGNTQNPLVRLRRK